MRIFTRALSVGATFTITLLLYIVLVPRGFEYFSPLGGPLVDFSLLSIALVGFIYLAFVNRIAAVDLVLGPFVAACLLGVVPSVARFPELIELSTLILVVISAISVRKAREIRRASIVTYFIPLLFGILTLLSKKLGLFNYQNSTFDIYNFEFCLSYGLILLSCLTFASALLFTFMKRSKGGST